VSGVAAAHALRLALAGYALLRLFALLHPSMALWGLNSGRFAPPLASGLLWLVPTLALLPPVGRRLDRWFEAAATRTPSRLVALLTFAAAAALMLLLPDRIWFVGDYLLREGAMRASGDFLHMFPQAQPLDVLLHYRLPHALLLRGVDSTLTARVIGALEAGLLALLARRFAAGSGLGPGPRLAVATAAVAGGYLALFAGYSKPTVEVCLLAVAVGTFGAELVRGGRGALAMVLAFALALGFHRSALSLLPGVLGFLILALLRDGPARRHRGELAAAGAVLVGVLAIFLPRLWQLFGAFDLGTNFLSHEVRAQGGPLAAAFSGLRLLDLVNLVALHAPLVVALPARLALRVRATPVGLGLAILFAGHLPAVLFTYVTQGAFRDWDAHAGAFAAFALLTAAALAGILRAAGDAPARAGLAPGAALAALGATLTVMVAQNDLDRGLARAHAFLAGPPARTESQQLATLDFLGLRGLRLERYGEAADAFAALAARAPHPRALVLEGTASLLAGRDAEALDAFGRLVARDSSHAVGWFGVWLGAHRTADSALARMAERRVLAYPDTGAGMNSILGLLTNYPGLWDKMPRGRFHAP